ncbi:membrane-associated protein, putative, partial [Bodo saltans]
MRCAGILSGAQWVAIWIVCLHSSNLLCYPFQVSALNAGPQVRTTTLVANAHHVTTVYIDAARNVLYFAAGNPVPTYIGRVALECDCGTAPLAANIVTPATTIAGSVAGFLDGIGRAAQLRPLRKCTVRRRYWQRRDSSDQLVNHDGGNPRAKFPVDADCGRTHVLATNARWGVCDICRLLQFPHRQSIISMGSATTITNIAGAVGQAGVLDGVNGSSARFFLSRGLALSSDGSTLFASSINGNVIQATRLDGTNATITIAGNGTAGFTEASGGRDFMLDPVAMFNSLQGIALWEQSTPFVLTKTNAPGWAVIAADYTNGVIRCVAALVSLTPFPTPAFEALATTVGTIRGVVGAGSSNDAYVHPITGSLFTSAGPSADEQWTVICYEVDNLSGAFVQPPVLVAGSTARYAEGATATALFDGIYGFAGHGVHMVYVTEYAANYCVRSINITTLEVDTVAGNRVSAVVDGVGTAASLMQPFGLAYHGLRNVLYVGGRMSPIRKIDLVTRNVTTIRLHIGARVPELPQIDTNARRTICICVCEPYHHCDGHSDGQTLIRAVAGTSGAPGTSDGFGSNARFTQPEGIALVGVEYGWPCLYVHEESPAYIREIRLRDQYVRTIPLIGLPAGFDIEGIVSYTNRTSKEFGLLLMNRGVGGGILFLPIGIMPAPTPSASSEQTSSTTTSIGRSTSQSATFSTHPTLHSATHSISMTRVSHSQATPSSSDCMTSSFSIVMTKSNSYSGSFSATTPTSTPSLATLPSLTESVCRCLPDAVRVALSAPVAACVACPVTEVVGDTIAVLGGSADLDAFAITAPAQLQSAPVARATLLLLPSAPLLVTLVVNGSSCWIVSSVATAGLNTSLVSGNVASSVGTDSQDDTFRSLIELLVTPTMGGGWLSGLASGDLLYQSKSLVLNVTLRCSSPLDGHATNDRFVIVTVPCPPLPRTLASEVTTGVTALQWISVVGGPGASGAMGRLTVVRSLALCSAAGGLSGLVTIDLSGCVDALAENSVGGLLGNIVIVVVATLLLLAVCWLLSRRHSDDEPIGELLAAGARRTAFPSTLLPIATMLIPTTAGLVVVVLRDLAEVSSPT